jgi:hypothetical protein
MSPESLTGWECGTSGEPDTEVVGQVEPLRHKDRRTTSSHTWQGQGSSTRGKRKSVSGNRRSAGVIAAIAQRRAVVIRRVLIGQPFHTITSIMSDLGTARLSLILSGANASAWFS